ncbi:hypothetical protein CBR_g37525 [Chara braunii]|uniref:Glycosyltransferase subfamily 4-like N-terminal domain-containing protein n=1 Tax=Chara braunii TaxID=69332 RepID=A0A388LN55_CHABU|nr:hypothetical protein CBR_g37525 [Chara braunii]|eukprot:GBG83724.1 hypothetical protein CBR_g37525 [Chara braunii]
MVRNRAAVVVLGDIGRSPRMQYHSLSLADQANLHVDIVAYGGSSPHEVLSKHPRIRMHLLAPPFTAGWPRALRLLALPVKVTFQVIQLLWTLCVAIPAPDVFLVQNPPSIPTFMVVLFACVLRGASMVIDWHNFAYTLLGLSLGKRHPLVTISRWYERYFGKKADAHICVTEAMRQELKDNWGIRATVLYDRAPDFFRPSTISEKHELFMRLHEDLVQARYNSPNFLQLSDWDSHSRQESPISSDSETDGLRTHPICNGIENPESLQDARDTRPQNTRVENDGSEVEDDDDGDAVYGVSRLERTLLTLRSTTANTELKVGTLEVEELDGGGHVQLNRDRPAVIVSSTSWGADEDFSLLLEAGVMYNQRVEASMQNYSSLAEGSRYPDILFIITGKGPLREEFEDRVRHLNLQHVAFRTLWLAAEDYPLLLGSADLGISLHTSSSGLDLPMKVVDMFGCGLPVCALAFSCIHELVKDGENGLLFSTSDQLTNHLLHLLEGFPEKCPALHALKAGAWATGDDARWPDEWETAVLPLLSWLRK